MNLQTKDTGEPCNCTDECFEKINEHERAEVIKHINSLDSHDKVNLYLTGLVHLIPVERRRVQNELEAYFRDATYSYSIRVMRNYSVQELKVCKAFIFINGISKGKMYYILNKMKKTGTPPTYKKGKHSKRPHKLSEATFEAVRNHIKSFKGRESHYIKKNTDKKYIADALNVSKMFEMFKTFQQENKAGIVCSLQSYRTINIQ